MSTTTGQVGQTLNQSNIMNKAIYIGVVIFLIGTLSAVSQDLLEFQAIDLAGDWQTDSASQLGAKSSLLSITDSPVDKVLSDDMDRAVKSREYTFREDGVFIAQWVMGSRPNVVRGRWDIVDKNRIVIDVDGSKTAYSVNASGKEGIVLVPLRERKGEIHELYFIRKK